MPSTGLHMRELALFQNLLGGFAENLGLRFTAVNPEEVAAELHIGQEHLQAAGLVNGGVFATIGETVGSVMGLVLAPGKIVVGVNNNTDFLHPVTAGVIVAETTVIHAGRSTQVIEVNMFHRERLVAKTTLRTMVIPQA
ncbi:PaaI family thioesterase [Corynebacterium felinum]